MAKRRRLLTVKRKGYARRGYARRGFTAVRDGLVKIPPTKVRASRVPPTTFKIKDVGAVGRGKKVIKEIRRGLLKQLGYSVKKPADERRTALRKADKNFGSIRLFKMLNAQVVLRKRTQPEARRVFVADRNWVGKTLLNKAERLKMTAKPRKKWMAMSPRARKLSRR